MQAPIFTVNCERVPKGMSYKIKFPYNEQLIGRIRDLPEETRKWIAGEGAWKLTTVSLVAIIKAYRNSNKIYFDFGSIDGRNVFKAQIQKIEVDEIEKRRFIQELNQNKENWLKYKEDLENNYENFRSDVHRYLKDGITLYPHQIVGTMLLNETKSHLLALDMGTGKTIISIAFVEMNDFNKVIVITPNSLKFNYFNEVEKFTNSKAYIIGRKNKYTIDESKYIIVNYEFFSSSSHLKLRKKFDSLNIGKIDCLIADESHRLKNLDSNCYKNFKKIFQEDIFKNKKVSKIFMSGTPAPSKAAELYTVLNQISPTDFASQKYFYEYYCGMFYNRDGFGWEKNITMGRFEELFNKIAPYTYRKKKSDVLKDLPEKTYQKIILEMTPKEYDIYYDLEEGVANEFNDAEMKNPLSIMGKLREYTSHLKINGCMELIDSILECGEKFVAVDFYKNSLRELHSKYPEVSKLHTGDENDVIRAEIVKEFQDINGTTKLFLGSEGTTKEGLTLTAASKIGVLTIPWTPGALDQITDRLCRIGQKNAVNAYLFIYKDSIDEYIFNLIEAKRSEIAQVIDGEKYESNINQSIIKDLIEIIKNKHNK